MATTTTHRDVENSFLGIESTLLESDSDSCALLTSFSEFCDAPRAQVETITVTLAENFRNIQAFIYHASGLVLVANAAFEKRWNRLLFALGFLQKRPIR